MVSLMKVMSHKQEITLHRRNFDTIRLRCSLLVQ